jgi:calcium/calmodulin-dependent protein kinase I
LKSDQPLGSNLTQAADFFFVTTIPTNLNRGEGGMLFDHIVARGQYSEKDAANIVRQILEGVSYMHNNGIAHRDLKPENLLAMDDNCDIVKISDFGLSKEFLGDNNLHTACGTPEYAGKKIYKEKKKI